RQLDDAHASSAVHAAHVRSSNTDHSGFHRDVGNALRFFDSSSNRADRRIEINNQAFAQPLRLRRAQRQKFHLLVINFRDEHGSLDAADVQSHYIFIFLRQDCSCFYRYLILVAEALLVSGLSTTCFAYCKSMEWTWP